MLLPFLIAFLVDVPVSPEQPKDASRPVYLMEIAASPQDGTLAVAGSNGSLWFVDTASGTAPRRIRVRGASIDNLIFAPDGKSVAVAAMRIAEPSETEDNTVTWSIVKTSGSAAVTALEVPEHVGLQARFRPHGTRLYLFTTDGGIRLADSTTGTTTKLPAPTLGRFTCACWWGDDKVVTGDSEGVVRVWAADTGTLIESMPPLAFSIDCVEIALDGKLLLTTFGPNARLWRLPDLTLHAEFEGVNRAFYLPGDGLFEAVWSRDQLLIASGTWYTIECRRFDGSLVWAHDLEHGDDARLLCSFDPNGKFASCTRDGGVEGHVFNAETGTRRTDGVLAGSAWDVIKWTADGKSVAMLHRSAGSVTIADTSSFIARRVLRLDEKGELVEATRR
jgi:WD40 repeat protein